MEAALLAGLNRVQRAAVTSSASVLQVLAPPGSGKTKTLTTRVAYLLAHHGYPPQNVICCTFTIKAAREMRERLRSLVGEEMESKLVLGTFHSICRRYLVAYGHLIGIPKGFGIADTSDTNSIVKRIIKKHSLNIDYKTARSRISSNKAKGKTLEELAKQPKKHVDQQEFVTVFQEYEDALKTSNLLDYDDLLLRCVDLLRQYRNCVANVEALLIDEFQDTNVVQFELMKLFAQARQRITIVGDPDQSIYGFRSAEIENLRRMRTIYPDTVVINLEENYRSAGAILVAAQDVIEQDTDRPDKKMASTHCFGTLPVLRRLPNPHEECIWIASEIKRITSLTGGLIEHSDIAVLIRSAYLSLLIEKAFTAAGIPYRMVGGMRFFDRVEIRIVVSYLRSIGHPDNDSALSSIINVPSRKIGDTAITSLTLLAEKYTLSLWETVKKVLNGTLTMEKKLSKPSEQDLQKLVNLIHSARQKMKTVPPSDVPSVLIDFVVSKLDLQGYLQKKYKDDYEDRIENIKELMTHAKDVAAMTSPEDHLPKLEQVAQQDQDAAQEALDQFLANIVLSSEVEASDKQDEKPRVTISTIHSAKGLEWPVVFVPAVYEGSIPHSRAEDTDEERRLLYVAMTRAQALLTMTFPIMQSRDSAESVLTQFLPANVHARLAEQGPSFKDATVADMATILRRPMPSQEALTKALQDIGDKESAEDDLWPLDGSPKWDPERMVSVWPAPGTNIGYTGGLAPYGDFQKSNFSTFSTTMSKMTTFSASAVAVDNRFATGFSTVKDLRSTAPSLFNQALKESPQVPPSKPPQLTRHTSSNSSSSSQSQTKTIDSFFSRKSQPAPPSSTNPPAAKKSDFTASSSNLSSSRSTFSSHLFSQHRQQTHPQPNISAPAPAPTIPLSLSAHKLSTSVFRPSQLQNNALAGTVKRPRPVLEPTSPNPKRRYVHLSSSPPPLDPEDEILETATGDDDVQAEPKEKAWQNATTKGGSSITVAHTAPVSLLGSQSIANNNKKVLGVGAKRPFVPWSERKHK